MPSAEVSRSDSNRSDASQKPRVSFNRDVHIKRIVSRENPRVSGAILGIDKGAIITSPIRKERVTKSKKQLAAEAEQVLRQADKVGCSVDNKGRPPKKYNTLPSRKGNKENVKEYPSNSLDRQSKKRQGSLEHIPPKKPPRTFASASNLNSTSRPSIFDIFKKPEKKVEPKKSNLRRSVSDASALRSKAFGPVDSNTRPRKRRGSDSEESPKKNNTKKQLTPIIEVSPREDYFTPSDKENISTNIPEASATTKDKKFESVTDQLKDYIDEVDEELYKETGIRITTPLSKKEPTPIIIDLDKAENISSNKKSKLNFGLGKKLKTLTQKKSKASETEHPKGNNVLVSSTPKKESNKKDIKINREKLENQKNLSSNKQTAVEDLEKSANRSPNMIHSSQKPVEKPPLTKGNTVNAMVKRLSNDSCSSPPPTRTNVLIMPNMNVQHNNNQPFSYTRGISPDKYRSNEDLPRDLPNSAKPVVYAQVVCGANGLSNGKQTIHTTYNGKRQPQSDSDEGLGGEDSLGFHRKYEPEKSYTHFGDDRFDSFLSDTDKLLDEIDKYKAESPILPKYRSPSNNGFSSYNGIMERGRGDGMDAKRRESLTEPDIEFALGGHSPSNHFSPNRTDLSTRRDILESRINRRINSKTTPSPEYPPNKVSRNDLYISEKSSKYFRNGSTSPVGFKEKYVSETKTDQFGERHTESRTKKVIGDPNDRLTSPGFRYNGFDNEPISLDSQISDYPSSPENHRFESSHQTNSNSRSRYRNEKSRLFKDKVVYQSTPEIHHNSYPDSRGKHHSYHDSLPREDKFQSTTSSSQLTRSERHLNREEFDRKFDSGIENDFRRDSSERYKPTRPTRTKRDLYNESEDEGFASSLLINSEKQQTESNISRKSRRDYDSDRNTREDDFFRQNETKFISRERSIDDGSHYDPRLDKDGSTLKRIEKKPPKPEKKSGLEKMKSLFMRDTKKKKEKEKEKTSTLQKVKSKNAYNRQEENELINEKIRSSPDYRYRRRLSTPSPTRDLPKNNKSGSTNGSSGSWFKSLDRIGKRKSDKHNKDDNLTSTEEEPITSPPKLTSSTSNLRFFGDTDQESNGDSVRGIKPTRKRAGLRSQSNRELHNISEDERKNTSTGKKADAHHKSLTNISETNRELKGSRTNLKPPVSPSHRYTQEPVHREDRRRRKRHDVSSVESSTEGDSSQQSQRSIVYLHAATVGDIPGPEYLRTGRRSASREDLTSNGSSFIQPQVKTLNRSFSVLAPWRPRHQRDAMDIDYTQYPKPTKNGKYEQKQSRNTSNRNDNSTLKKKAQDSKKNNYQQTLNRKSRSKENLTKQPKEEMLRGSTSTLYKKKDKMPRENSRYNKDREERRIPTKSQSVESINRSREESRDVSRSVSMPRDSGKSAGWFKKTKKVSSNQRL